MSMALPAEPFAFSSLDERHHRRHLSAARRGASSGTSMERDSSKISELDASWSMLMTAAQDGDKAAYGRLLRECTPLIKRIVRRGIRPDQVDDVVQEVLLTVHRARPGSSSSPSGARSTSCDRADETSDARSTRLSNMRGSPRSRSIRIAPCRRIRRIALSGRRSRVYLPGSARRSRPCRFASSRSRRPRRKPEGRRGH